MPRRRPSLIPRAFSTEAIPSNVETPAALMSPHNRQSVSRRINPRSRLHGLVTKGRRYLRIPKDWDLTTFRSAEKAFTFTFAKACELAGGEIAGAIAKARTRLAVQPRDVRGIARSIKLAAGIIFRLLKCRSHSLFRRISRIKRHRFCYTPFTRQPENPWAT